jgi:hypothetical protein
MGSTRKSVIAISMMALVAAVAPKSASAAEDEATGEATAAAPNEAPATAEDDEAAPRQREPKVAASSEAAGAAETAAPSQDDTRVFGGPAQLNHKYQTGLSIMPGSGYRFIVRYKDGQYCGDSSGQNKPVCANYVPFFLDFQLAFGVAARADAILELRFGLQEDPAVPGSHQFAVAPGLRFWLDQDIALKFYTTLQFVYDHTDFANSGGIRSSDVGMRNANGLMYDPIRNVGFFVQFGETIAFMRWFRIDLDLGVGAQIRFP